MDVIEAKHKRSIASITLTEKTKLTNYNSNLNRVGRAKRGKLAILVLGLIGRENQFLRFHWLRVCVTRVFS